MYEIKLNWESGRKESKQFDDYNEMISFLADNPDAGFSAWEDGQQMNQADIARDVEIASA